MTKQLTTEAKAYRLQGMIRAAILAQENETSGLFADGNGVTWVLEAAEELAEQIADDIVRMQSATARGEGEAGNA